MKQSTKTMKNHRDVHNHILPVSFFSWKEGETKHSKATLKHSFLVNHDELQVEIKYIAEHIHEKNSSITKVSSQDMVDKSPP